MKKYDIQNIRQKFPILKKIVYNNPLVYLDNAATTQKPLSVIESISNFYLNSNANIDRSSHFLAEEAYQAVSVARERFKSFINAYSTNEIIFTKGTTEGINLIANAYGASNISQKQEIMISQMEHASNVIPWQVLANKIGCCIKIIPILLTGDLDLEWLKTNISEKTKLIALCYASNVLGTINQIKKITTIAKAYGAKILVDAAQAAAHLNINVQDLDCDFLVASAHKFYGPTGVGFLYIKESILSNLTIWQSGGGMFEDQNHNKFEAGTLNIAGIVGAATAINFLQALTLDSISSYEESLARYLISNLKTISNVIFYGTSTHRVPIITFNLSNMNPFDVGILLDSKGIAVRTGKLCSPFLPIFYHWTSGAIRISIGLYNTINELDYVLNIIEEYSKKNNGYNNLS